MVDLVLLAARIESAKGPDRGIDAEIHAACGLPASDPPRLTASLDAIVALIERVSPGMDWDVGHHTIEAPHYQGITYPFKGGFTNTEEGGGALMADHAKSPALALCLAFVETLRLAHKVSARSAPRLRVVSEQ